VEFLTGTNFELFKQNGRQTIKKLDAYIEPVSLLNISTRLDQFIIKENSFYDSFCKKGTSLVVLWIGQAFLTTGPVFKWL
jgi:hypothetical protein